MSISTTIRTPKLTFVTNCYLSRSSKRY